MYDSGGRKGKYMQVVRLKDDFIRLGQALKLSGMIGSGVEAKFIIQDGLVRVNGEVEVRRGKKLVNGDVIEYNGSTVKIEAGAAGSKA
jgi:ribosome-associated protein